MVFLVRCPDCGKLHLVGPEKCGCGHRFSGRRGSADSEWGNCRRCGLPVKAAWKECPECHSDLSRALGYRCPKCGRLAANDARYCECGQELLVLMGDCPHCRGRIRADSVNCPKCGRSVRGGEGGQGEDVWVCSICGSRLQYYGAHCFTCNQ